ncbi:hypothetical protein [Phenylobacterium sp.]|uniref:hypothetical protein n=1 Tax=Phenylobacterium sp. TaxID=1871053 RepID=UPI002730A649|nr:hypothetical protein [Phenylobacterium sp.]MDP1599514.1 hypothetical protein [Phenylobacterium sp.]MDP3593508.1 hypothetical protein [Phenylobacterium sp.]
MILALGGAFSISEGFLKIINPEPLTKPWINFLMPGVAIGFESAWFAVAWRESRRKSSPG